MGTDEPPHLPFLKALSIVRFWLLPLLPPCTLYTSFWHRRRMFLFSCSGHFLFPFSGPRPSHPPIPVACITDSFLYFLPLPSPGTFARGSEHTSFTLIFFSFITAALCTLSSFLMLSLSVSSVPCFWLPSYYSHTRVSDSTFCSKLCNEIFSCSFKCFCPCICSHPGLSAHKILLIPLVF